MSNPGDNSATIPDLPNPFTPFAFLPPDVADQVAQGRYMLFIAVGVSVASHKILSISRTHSIVYIQAWLWDAVMSLSQEYHIFATFGIKLPDVAYIVSR